MPQKDNFFSSQNTVRILSEKDLAQTANYLSAIDAFSRLSNISLYVIDYQKKGFDYVSENPLFLCGFSNEEVKEMGYDFYFKCVPEKDLELLLEINQIGFNFYENIPLEERLDYSISYDFNIKNQEEEILLINHKLTPLFLTEKGKIWKALCVVSLSTSNTSGNIQIYYKNKKVSEYDRANSCWKKSTNIILTHREVQIIRLSIRGLKIDEIAKKLNISYDTVKYHRKQLFEKMQVSNITDAILYATQNNLM